MAANRLYQVNEIFFSLQGEGIRTGTANVFVRFSGCNVRCSAETHGFECDTEFVSGKRLCATEIVQCAREIAPECRWVILTGGEPLIQVDFELCRALKNAGYSIAVETNGTINPPEEVLELLDWIVCSPKVPEEALQLRRADELKYVRAFGQELPQPTKLRVCPNKLISPAFDGDRLNPQVLEWCIRLVMNNPDWRLTFQAHKLLMFK